MTANCDVVVTGIGLISPLGIGLDATWDALIQGKSGVGVRAEFADESHPFRIAGEVRDFEPKKYVKPRKALKVMCRPIQLGFAASTMAAEQAELAEQVAPERISTLFGTEAFYADPHEVAAIFRKCIVNRCYDHDRWGQHAMREIEPLWMLKYLPNMVASHISIVADARGPSNTICQAEVSGLLAVIESIDLLRRGAVDAVIAGGTGSLMATTGMIYRGLHRLSRRVHEPERASRPFDAARDGMVVGEGSGTFILEREADAKARGANILGRVLGYSRGFHPTTDQFSDAIAHTLSEAIERSGLTRDDIGHVNAHGFGTIEDDIREAKGIRSALGDVPVIAPKSSFGNLGPGASVVETAMSIQASKTGTLPGTLNIDSLDERCPIQLVTKTQTNLGSKPGAVLNFTDSGQVACLVVGA